MVKPRLAPARRNRGATALRRRWRTGDPMADFDRLDPLLRAWLAQAALPWSPRSVARAFARELAAARGRRDAALAALDRLERRRIAFDAAQVWGSSHPAAQPAATPEPPASWR
jgi:hypothetical protein